MTERPSLSAVPGLKRTSALPGPPPRKSRANTAPDEPLTSSPVAATALPTPSPKEGKSRTPRRVNEPAANSLVPVTLSLPVPVVQRLKRYAKDHDLAYANVIMDAIVAHRDELGTLVSHLRPNVASDGIFVRTTPRKSAERTTLSFRTRRANVVALDELWESDEIAAENRSQLCHAALDAYLP
jgi:hypothetical protein